MDKNIIKKYLSETFLSEKATPGITMADKMKKEETKVNKDGVKAIEKDMTAYDKDLKKTDKSKMAPNKFNYSDDAEKTYHDEMEIKNGLEMTQYDRTNKEFTDRAEKAIVGDTTMGNAIGANAEQIEGVSSDKFGKDFLKKTKAAQEKRDKAEIPYFALGDDAEELPKGVEKGTKKLAVSENKTNNKTENKESMKKLNFKKEFEGVNTTQKVGHALTLIPEAYKADKKEFILSDGNVTCKIRWEGSLTEGKAIVLSTANKKLVNEDMQRMKDLFNYKSESTLGLLKGNARLDENAAFSDVWNKTKKLLSEEENIESVKAPVKDADSAVKVAPEAKKAIEGSVSTDKGTKAPAPKKGSMESIDDAVGHASEAKKHVEGSVSTDKGTKAPAPKEGEWEEISVPQAADAKKHIESGTATHKKTDTAKVVKEEEENPMDKLNGDDEEEIEVGVEPETAEVDDDSDADTETDADKFYKADADDDSAEEKEPTAKDIPAEVPVPTDVPTPKGGAKIMSSPSNPGKLYIKDGMTVIEVPAQYMELANSKAPNVAKIILDKMEVEAAGGEGSEEEEDF